MLVALVGATAENSYPPFIKHLVKCQLPCRCCFFGDPPVKGD